MSGEGIHTRQLDDAGACKFSPCPLLGVFSVNKHHTGRDRYPSAVWEFHEVSQCVPHLNLSAKELASHPKFSRLLLSLTDRLDRTGLSLSLKRDLERASGDLRARRWQWLAAEALERTVEELAAERHAAHAEKAPNREDQQFLETLEQCWALGRCRRGLDMRTELTEDPQPPLLGLRKDHLNELQPGTKEVLAMRRRLVTEVEQRLVRQCVELLTYVWPQYDGESPGVVLARGRELVEWIQAEELRVDGLMQQDQFNQAAISRQMVACLTVLMRCYELLRTLTETHRLDCQPLLDQSLLEYLKLKRQMMFSKLRLLRLEVHQEMFNRDVVGAHRTIRELLQEALSLQEARLGPTMGQLDLFRQLGPEFEDLVQEYNRLLGRLEHKRWALNNFSETLGNGGSG
ncbi:HAUS augmin-like complex subunit 4 isoform X2 [Mobula hypostoma]|uniref:HAUS augmin-like complex subunit 4 isoform X2 n=1 Tax=Mobula hypostoma TaxID=723540 RepID=UPI002FC38667